ncbi:MAG: hypothetical protein MJ231_04240 [bacterium]|nr:hypothetical protein [bacterium]
MKKLLGLLLILFFVITPVSAKTDTASAEYLQNKKHFAIMNPLAESIAQKVIRKQLKKETGAKFKVKFEGYTLSSMKKGVFKNLDITGKKVTIEDIYIPNIRFKTITDYNRIDYTKNPPVFLSDMEFAYEFELNEKSLNDALSSEEYKRVIHKTNRITYPVFAIYNVRAEIKNGKVNILAEYNFPIMPARRNKILVLSSSFDVRNGKIFATDTAIESSLVNIPLDRATKLINILDPLSFTLDIIENKKCNARIDNIKIVDDIIQINGKIFVKGDK